LNDKVKTNCVRTITGTVHNRQEHNMFYW